MLRKLYDWTMRKAEGPYALLMLALIAFAESSIFPIPPDVLLIPMVIAAPQRAWLYAGVATVASVLGGIAGYGIGALFYESWGQQIIAYYGFGDKFSTFEQTFSDWGAWAVFIAGVTPFPYKVITITSGLLGLNFAVFIIASIAARALRFFIVAGLLKAFGPAIRGFIEKRLGLMFTLFVVLLLGGFFAIKFLH